MARNVYQYEQPRCPDGWNESERRFYARLIQVLDDIYAKYGNIDEKMLSKNVTNKINNASDDAIEKLAGVYSEATVGTLYADLIVAETARITNLVVEKMVADTIQAGTIVADTIQATFAYLVSLSAKHGEFDFATVKNLLANALEVEKLQAGNVNIKNLSVSDANIVDLNAEKITAGQIDASKIDVINIDAGNITVGAINGQMIAPGTILGDSIRVGSIDDTLLAIGCVNADKLAGGAVVKDKLALGSVTADKLATRQHILFGDDYKLEHRTGETNTQIAWSGLSIQYNGVSYPVQDGSTNASYVFWKIDNPRILYASNAYPELGEDDCLVYVNKNGVALTVPGATTFDGSVIVPGTVTADAIAANSITGDRLAAYTIQAGAIAAGAIFGDKIAAGGISADHLAAAAVTAGKIAAKAVTSDTLAVQEIMASEALVQQILARHIDVEDLIANEGFIEELTSATAFISKLFSNEAFIDLLRTGRIIGDKSITMIAQEAAGSNRNFRQAEQPTGTDLVRPGDMWVDPATGQIYQAEDASVYNLQFALDEEGNLYYSMDGAPESFKLEVQGFDLYSNGIYFTVNEDGSMGVPYVWVRIQDQDVLDAITGLEDKVDGKTTVYYQADAPSDPEERDLWYSDAGVIYRYSGGKWLDVTTTTLKTALDAAAGAQDTADAAQDAIDQYALDMAPIISDINKNISDLQNQIDGSISTWFYDGEPTLNNLPASEWTTDATRDEHIGDLYYDNITGYCYRFQKSNGVYSWKIVSDSDVSKALEAAKEAKDIADSKRRVFVTTPKPPYDEGDLWVQGTGGDIMRCQTSKSEGGIYAASDWVRASKYTDDTVASSAQSAANKAQATADGKIVTFAQPSAPTAAAVGDLWIDTDNDNMLYRWNGSAWLPYRDQLILDVQAKAEFATIHDGAEPPAAPVETGKIWIDRSGTPPVMRRWLGLALAPDNPDGWENVNDLTEINQIADELVRQQAVTKAIADALATALTVQTDGVHIHKPGQLNQNEVFIDENSVDIKVGGTVYSSFIPRGAVFGRYRVWQPEEGGGLAFNLIV